MTPKEKAEELFDKMLYNDGNSYHHCSHYVGKNCALIAVDEIICSNPHSNPLNTNATSTMGWWVNVKNEIEKL